MGGEEVAVDGESPITGINENVRLHYRETGMKRPCITDLTLWLSKKVRNTQREKDKSVNALVKGMRLTYIDRGERVSATLKCTLNWCDGFLFQR